ncbi:MAG: zinc ribbon domain-containing protein [Candidatus Bathyarchaeia archaeon]
MFCSSCGAELPPEAQTCPRCGAVIARASPTPLGTPQNADQIIAENPPPELQQVQSSIPLNEGERILWHKETTRGLVHKEVVMEEAVTNKRCLKYNTESKQLVAQIGITHWPEVVIMNVHRVNDSLGGGVFLTPRMFGLPGLGGFGVYGGPRRGMLKVFGDISFLSEGKVIMTFENVKDPQGVKQLVEALKRQEGFQGPRRVRPWLGPRFRPRQQ